MIGGMISIERCELMARQAWQSWLLALELLDESWREQADPQVGDTVLEISTGGMALQRGMFMPSSLGKLLTPLREGQAVEGELASIERLDNGEIALWPQGRFILVR